MKTVKFLIISAILTALVYLFIAGLAGVLDFREWAVNQKTGFLVLVGALDLFLIHRFNKK